MTGIHWLEGSRFLDGPVLITNTDSVGVVRDAYLAWLVNLNALNLGFPVTAASFAAHDFPIGRKHGLD
jgi:hypothetical protein